MYGVFHSTVHHASKSLGHSGTFTARKNIKTEAATGKPLIFSQAKAPGRHPGARVFDLGMGPPLSPPGLEKYIQKLCSISQRSASARGARSPTAVMFFPAYSTFTLKPAKNYLRSRKSRTHSETRATSASSISGKIGREMARR